MKKIAKALIPAAILLSCGVTAHAATSDGKTVGVSVGWLHVMPQGKKQGVTGSSDILGADYAPNAGFEIKDADTAALLLDYYVNDNVSLELVAGVPPKMKIEGKGRILNGVSLINKGSGVDLANLGEVGDVKAYTPTLLGKYQFGTVNSKFRPFVGAGIMYAHFSGFKLGSNVNQKLDANTQMTLGDIYSAPIGAYISKVKIDDAIAPVATIGADYNINKNWFVTGSVTYAHLKTRAKLEVGSTSLENPQAVKGESDIEINPIATYLGIGYRF